VNSTVTHQLPVLYTTRHLPVRHRISAIMSGEMHVTGPPEIDDDLRHFDVTPYSGTWWAGSPYQSFKDFMEHMNRNDAGLFRTSVCTAIVDEGENYLVNHPGRPLNPGSIRHDSWTNAAEVPSSDSKLAGRAEWRHFCAQ
jgi:hypothetical protein